MSAIKEFFKKKKTDAKFKLAGSGQKLGDNASSSGQSSRPTSSRAAAASSSSSNQGAKSNRGALSHEQRLAASAALQRYVNFFLAGSKSELALISLKKRFRFSNAPSNADDFEKRRSQAAIRAQALKELEREEQAASAAEKLRDTYGEKPLIECEIAPSGGSSTVLYKCPLIGDQVLPKEEMRQAIKDFLYSQIEAEPGLTACLIIHTLNTDTEKVQTGENSYNFFWHFQFKIFCQIGLKKSNSYLS